MNQIRIVKRVIKAAGGPAKLARAISELAKSQGKPDETITMQAVVQWIRVPAERVKYVERITGLPRHVLRPDLYDAPAERARA